MGVELNLAPSSCRARADLATRAAAEGSSPASMHASSHRRVAAQSGTMPTAVARCGPPSPRPLPDDPARHGRRRRRASLATRGSRSTAARWSESTTTVRSSSAEPRSANERKGSHVRPLWTSCAIGARPRAAARTRERAGMSTCAVGPDLEDLVDGRLRRGDRRVRGAQRILVLGDSRHPTATTCGCPTAASSSSRPTSRRSSFAEATLSTPPYFRSSWPARL